MSNTPENYRHVIDYMVRFADLDALGHLNHTKYLTYMEQSRILYVRDVCGAGSDWSTFGIILARAEVDYKLPVQFEDTVRVYTRVSRMGGKSFDMEYVLIRQRPDVPDAIAATGKTIMVTYDYQSEQAIPIPQDWRERITDYEPGLEAV